MGEYLVMMCDYGLDDAVATCAVLNNAERFSRIDILAIGGNFSAEVSLKNLHTLAALVEHDSRLTIVDTTDVPQPCDDIPFIHGNDGMGDAYEARTDGTATVRFSDWLENYEGCDTLLSLGPMTLTETILKKALPRRFLFMAGNICAEPNYNGYEFNEGINPRAFAECVKYPHKGVVLDTACPALDVINSEIPLTGVYNVLADRCRSLALKRGETSCHIWDDIAVRYLLDPSSFEERMARDKNGNVVNTLVYVGEKISFT